MTKRAAVQKFIIRMQNWWNRTPRNFTGSVLANYMGWQLLRIFWFNIRFYPRLKRVSDIEKKHAETLKRDGIVLIPNFLPQEVFDQIKKEFKQIKEDQTYRPLASAYIVQSNKQTRMEYAHILPEPETHFYELLDKYITKSSLLTALGSLIVHQRFHTYRPPQVLINRIGKDQYVDLNSDIYYHADVSYPGVKGFYYLSDTDTANGAFMYAKGSHKINLRRLYWEYRKSIEHAKSRKGATNKFIQGDETGRSWHCMTREEEAREGIQGTSMVGKANSLVLFDVRGFHRRGEFTSERPREFVLAYYRD